MAISIEGKEVVLKRDDVEITSSDIPGWSVATEDGITVALDITLTEDLKKEGLARDLVNRIQNLRKEQGMEVQDKIAVSLDPKEDWVKDAVNENHDYICTETQAVSLQLADQIDDAIELEIDDLKMGISIKVQN